MIEVQTFKGGKSVHIVHLSKNWDECVKYVG